MQWTVLVQLCHVMKFVGYSTLSLYLFALSIIQITRLYYVLFLNRFVVKHGAFFYLNYHRFIVTQFKSDQESYHSDHLTRGYYPVLI